MVFQIDRPRLLAAVAAGDLAKQVQWRAQLVWIVHHMRQKQAFLGRMRHHVLAQCLKQFKLTVNRAQIKKNRDQHQSLGFGVFCPALKIPTPNMQRLAPLVGHGHHLTRAVDEATGCQAVADPTSQGLEMVAVQAGLIGVVQHHAVVLVRFGGLFTTPLRASRHPDIGHGWGADFRLGQCNQATGQCIGDGRDDVTGVVGAGVGGTQVVLQALDLPTDAHQPF